MWGRLSCFCFFYRDTSTVSLKRVLCMCALQDCFKETNYVMVGTCRNFLWDFWYRIRRNDGTHMSSVYVPYLRKMMLALYTIDNKGMYWRPVEEIVSIDQSDMLVWNRYLDIKKHFEKIVSVFSCITPN